MEEIYKFIFNEINKIIIGKNINSVCDYGCGNGELLNEIINSNPELKRAIGIDYFSKLKNKEKLILNKKIDYIDKDTEEFHNLHNSGKFDLVLSTFALHHYEYPVEELKTIFDILNENGILIIIDFNYKNISDGEKVKNYSSFVDEILYSIKNNFHHHHYTIKQAIDLMKSIDIEISDVKDLKYFETDKEKSENLKEYLERNQSKSKSLKNAPDLYRKIFARLYELEEELLNEYGVDHGNIFIISGKK